MIIKFILFNFASLCITLNHLKMNHSNDQDYGEFNDSMVILHPIKLTTQPATKITHHPAQSTNHLGIYNDLKLSPLIKQKQGKLLTLVTLDRKSMNTFLNDQAIRIIQQYPTNEIAFVFVVGNQKSGKSFFVDKILNLAQIKGNQFSRNSNDKNVGINMWSTPFEKDTLKIFLCEISNCDIDSQQFKILSTYSIVIGSVFFIIDGVKNSGSNNNKDKEKMKDDGLPGIVQFDTVLTDLSMKLSRVQQIQPPSTELSLKESFKYLPEYIYYLKRTDLKRNLNLQSIKYFIQQILPDAKSSSFKGSSQELIHLSFLDSQSINQNYVRNVGKIFKEMFEVISQKKFNQLILNGGIVVKILKYIENYLNNHHEIQMGVLYTNLIEELYTSAYNFCILTYHESMQKSLQNEQPKSLDELLEIFQQNSLSILEKFQEFNLDPVMHGIYFQKLQKHIDDKERLIMQVNQLKTERVIMESYNPNQLNNVQVYRSTLKNLKDKLGHLSHGRAEALARLNGQFYKRMENVDHKSLARIASLQQEIETHQKQFKSLQEANISRTKDKNEVESLMKKQQELQKQKKQLRKQIQLEKQHQKESLEDIKQETLKCQELVKKNNTIISQLKGQNRPEKNKEHLQVQSRLQETKLKADKLETLLNQLKVNNNNVGGGKEGEKGKTNQNKGSKQQKKQEKSINNNSKTDKSIK